MNPALPPSIPLPLFISSQPEPLRQEAIDYARYAPVYSIALQLLKERLDEEEIDLRASLKDEEIYVIRGDFDAPEHLLAWAQVPFTLLDMEMAHEVDFSFAKLVICSSGDTVYSRPLLDRVRPRPFSPLLP